MVDADLKGYFDSIPQDKLMTAVEEHSGRRSGAGVDPAVPQARRHGKRQRMAVRRKQARRKEAVLSPLLANIYLNPLDHLMARQGLAMVRYADDFVILCQSQAEAQQALRASAPMGGGSGTDAAPNQNAHRRCQPSWRVSTFWATTSNEASKWPREKSLEKFKETIRQKTKSGRPGSSMKQIIAGTQPNCCAAGLNYFKHSIEQRLPSTWTDGYGGRLRTILRKRHKGQGRAPGAIISDGQMLTSPNSG